MHERQRPAWSSMQIIPGQPGLHSENLSQKKKSTHEHFWGDGSTLCISRDLEHIYARYIKTHPLIHLGFVYFIIQEFCLKRGEF